MRLTPARQLLLNPAMNWITRFFRDKTATSPPPAEPSVEIDKPSSSASSTPPDRVWEQNLSSAQLKQFVPLRDLDEDSIAHLPHTTLVHHRESIIFRCDQPAECVYYLLEGRLQLEPESDSAYEVTAGTPLSSLPLNSGKICGATATALTDVKILRVSSELNLLWAKQCRKPQTTLVELVDLDLPAVIANQAFFNSFAKAYHSNNLRLPSLPNVAFKLKQAMQHDIGIDEAVEIIHIDPPIVAKLIQVANSPLYSSNTPITNCHDAINRIGLNATRNLVMSISLKHLFQSSDKELMKGMQSLWRNSVILSSLSFVLAQECSDLNPEDALLAGLVADIGAIPLLHFAEQYLENSPGLAELEASLPYLRGPVGALVLHTLGFSGELVNIPHQAENWHYDSGEQITLSDIVILAKLHSYFGSPKARELPYINSIPAYCKITQRKLDADFSLMVLRQAQNRINAAMQLLS